MASDRCEFLSEESYQKYSCLPSFVEFLEKHLDVPPSCTLDKDGDSQTCGNLDNEGNDPSKDGRNVNNTGGCTNRNEEKWRSYSPGSASCVPEMDFPFVSKLSQESQKLLLETYEMIKSRDLTNVDLQKLKSVQEIKTMVLSEQEEFQKFVYNHAKVNHYLFNFIHPDVWDSFKSEVEGKYKASIGKYPQKYTLHETIGMSVGAVFKSDAVLTFEKTLQQMGKVSLLNLPKDTSILLVPEFLSTEDKELKAKKLSEVDNKVVSEDPVALTLARKHEVDIVISSSGLSTLLDNQPPSYKTQWQLPINVRRHQENQEQFKGQRMVFIDKPLPPKSLCPRAVNWKFFKRVLRKLVGLKPLDKIAKKRGDLKGSDFREIEALGDDAHPNSFQVEVEACAEERTSRKGYASTNAGIDRGKRLADNEDQEGEVKRLKIAKSNSVDTKAKTEIGSSEKYFVYNLWRYGNLKILIRCSVDAYRVDSEKTNPFTFFSVLPKLEYQATFGHERLSYSETARLWLHCYIRPQTKLICGRINVFSSQLLRVDELSINDILQQGTGFNPAQGMKGVFQVFQALKRLPEGKYILSHNCNEMHACLYKSQGSLVKSGPCLKSSFDLQKEKSPVINNYTEAEIPWVAIDCNLFLPWQIREKRIPCTFPAIPAKDLASMAQREKRPQPKKKKNKKGKRNKTGQTKAFANNKANPQVANEQINKFEPDETSPHRKTQDRKLPQQKRPNRKSMDKGRLFASFYDLQPTEKESEVFAVARRACGAVTYDDVDF